MGARSGRAGSSKGLIVSVAKQSRSAVMAAWSRNPNIREGRCEIENWWITRGFRRRANPPYMLINGFSRRLCRFAVL